MEKLDTKFTEEKPRYYVVRMDDKGKRPTRPFVSRNTAHRSAEKLARENPNVDFIVVKLKATIRYKKKEEVPVVESKESTDTGNVGS